MQVEFVQNKQIFTALAGAFIFMPLLLMLYVFSRFNVDWAQTDAAKINAQIAAEISAHSWLLLFFMLLISFGSLLINVAALHKNRPTVAQAMGVAAKTMPLYLLASLMYQIPLQILSFFTAKMGGAGSFISLLASVLISVRLMLYVPILARGHVRSPVQSLISAWRMAQGNFGKILFFVLLSMLASSLLALAIFAFASMLFALILPYGAASFMTLMIAAFVLAAMALIFILASITIYRELETISA